MEARKKATPPAATVPSSKINPEKTRASLLDRTPFGWFRKQGASTPPETRRKVVSNWRTPIDPQAQDAFIRRFAHVAIAERKKFGVPSSLILANGLLQSQAGYNQRVRRGNNYFALPCTPDWRGATMTIAGECYRAYDTAWMSFRDHSLFVAKGPYAPQHYLLDSDYEGWIKQLVANGYPVSAEYAEHLIKRIEQLQLFTIDQQEE